MHQGHAQRVLQRAIGGDRVPHAYVFHGPDGVGKERLAMGFAGRLLCGEPVTRSFDGATADRVGLPELTEGCGKCVDCRTIAAGNHADIHLVHRYLNRDHPDPAVRRRKGVTLSIDVIRHFLIEPAGLTAQRGRGKVFVVREADRMTPQAQNALLKTLEEPPSDSFIILLARSTDAMLETTRSRCQPVRFDALPRGFVEARLRQARAELSADLAGWYAGIAQGSIGEAINRMDESLHEINEVLAPALANFPPCHEGVSSNKWLDQAKSLTAIYKKRDPDITETDATRTAIQALLLCAATLYGDALRLISGRSDDLVNQRHRREVERMAGRLDAESAARAVQRIARTEADLATNVNTQLVLDALLIDLERIATPAPTRR
jgi:DNA polymerase-3 subunit delta'